MSSTEKRFFTLYNNIVKKDTKKTTLLFNEINKQTILNEDPLKELVGVSSYANYKQLLFEEILICLFMYAKKSSLEKEMLHELSKVQVLLDKQMYQEAYKKNKRLIKRMTKENAMEDILLPCYISFQKTLHFVTDDSYEKLEESITVNEALNTIIAVYNQKTIYKNILLKLRLVIKNRAQLTSEKEFLSMIENVQDSEPILQQNIQNISSHLLPIHIYTQVLPYIVTSQYDKCYSLLSMGLKELNKHDISFEKLFVIKTVSLMLQTLISLNKLEEFQTLYTFIQTQNINVNAENALSLFFIKIRYIEVIVKTDWTDWTYQEVKNIEQYIETYQAHLSYNYSYAQYRLMEFYFQNAEYQKAIDTIDLNLFEQHKNSLHDYLTGLYWCLCFCYLEVNNLHMNSKYINHLQYFIKSSNTCHPYQKAVMSLVTRISRNWDNNPTHLFMDLWQLTQAKEAPYYLGSKILERYAQNKLNKQ